jgi:hypothetical protein
MIFFPSAPLKYLQDISKKKNEEPDDTQEFSEGSANAFEGTETIRDDEDIAEEKQPEKNKKPPKQQIPPKNDPSY